MRFRHLILLAGTIGVVFGFTPTSKVLAQQATGTAKSVPRTPGGDPDLQGIWSNSTITPLERPKELADKAILTNEDAAGVEANAAARNVDRPPREGDVGTYNQFWFDRGTKVVPTRRTSLIIDPPDGKLPELTPAGKKRDEDRFKRLGPTATGSSGDGPFDSYRDISVVTRCITRGMPNAMIPGAYNNNFQILQVPGFVVVLSEMMHDTRVIPLDGRPHLGANVQEWMGDSRGHWEGDTLVVDITNFPDRDVTGFGVGYRYSETSTLHLTERFTRIDADTIDYQVTVDDPGTFTRPWTASVPLVKAEGPLYEYACHEGNYGITNILTGSRAQDKRAPATAEPRQ
jgi:hypothetical protein